jgi:hypothetical protein
MTQKAFERLTNKSNEFVNKAELENLKLREQIAELQTANLRKEKEKLESKSNISKVEVKNANIKTKDNLNKPSLK